jgi:hypothetical protein
MGLDTSHDCWHGAYSAFNRWRDQLAEAAGYTGHKSASGTGYTPDIDWGDIESTIGHDLNGKWPAIPVRPSGKPDPLIILLAHSDCGGELHWEFCGALADRLEELLPELDKLEDDNGHIGNWREKTEQFIAGLREAHKAKENVEFF